ncbi:MAG: hypothetical protein WC089_03545 [Candidatus Paceibacterota bacterium]
METKNCQNCKKDFNIEPDDFSFYEKMKVPAPTFCPECRRNRRMAWRNFINFYHRESILSGKNVLSVYSPESGVPVMSPKEWHAEDWDPKSYAMDYDFSKSFFLQYAELLKKVPKPAMDNDDGLLSKNCEYTSDFAMGKDCYLVIKAWKLENVMYSFYVVNSRDLVDVNTSFGKDEENYETINTKQCYRCRNSIDCQGCVECLFSFDLRNCNNCFMCAGLRGKSYCYKNEEVGKEKYLEILKSYNLHTYTGVEKAKAEFDSMYNIHPKKAVRMVNCVNSTGDLIFNCNNCTQCFCVLDSENSRYCTFADGVRDSYDADASGGSELAYESDLAAYCSKVIGAYSAWHCQDSAYLNQVYRSKDCFGCTGLKDSRYCILNKQYSREEYFEMVEKIKKHMIEMPYVDSNGLVYSYGDFLPVELSYFGYNDSVANDLYPMDEADILDKKYPYQNTKHKDIVVGALNSDLLPDSIYDVDDSILSRTIVSKKTQRYYKITPDELAFYRKHSIPIPRESFYERYNRRFKLSTSFRLYKSKSSKSGDDVVTCYDPSDNNIVWSLDEYKNEFE